VRLGDAGPGGSGDINGGVHGREGGERAGEGDAVRGGGGGTHTGCGRSSGPRRDGGRCAMARPLAAQRRTSLLPRGAPLAASLPACPPWGHRARGGRSVVQVRDSHLGQQLPNTHSLNTGWWRKPVAGTCRQEEAPLCFVSLLLVVLPVL